MEKNKQTQNCVSFLGVGVGNLGPESTFGCRTYKHLVESGVGWFRPNTGGTFDRRVKLVGDQIRLSSNVSSFPSTRTAIEFWCVQ